MPAQTLQYEYVAYKVNEGEDGAAESLSRACSFNQAMDVQSRVASLEWGATLDDAYPDTRLTDPEQQRTVFAIISDEGAISEYPPVDYDMQGGDKSYDFGDFTLVVAADMAQIAMSENQFCFEVLDVCLLYTSPSPRDQRGSRMPSSA